MNPEKGQDPGKKNASENRVDRGNLHLGKDNLTERMGEPSDAQSEGDGKGALLTNRRPPFMQRNQSPDHHTHQSADEEMNDFFSGVLNLFGMFVDPITGKRF